MDLSLYRARSGAYIAVPDCMLPPFDIERHHGPLRLLHRVQLPDASAPAYAGLAQAIETRCHALLSPEEAARLLAPEGGIG